MNTRIGSGWQTVLADLSLILFMVTAAAVSQASPQPATGETLALGEPVAVWRPGALSLGAWLSQQPHDPRLRLTIVAHAAQAQETGVISTMLTTVGPLPQNSRFVLERSPGPRLTATLAYDSLEPDAQGDPR